MKIGIVGPGALGCLFSAMLVKSGHQVWLLDHRPERARQIDAQGIELHDQHGASRVPVRATVDPEDIGRVALALLCVKADAVAVAVRNALPILAPDSLLIALQNGIAHHDRLDTVLSGWALGVTAMGASLLGPGAVRHGGSGLTQVGFLGDVEAQAAARLEGAVGLMRHAGIAAAVSPDIRAAAWNKLIVNAGINALTALADCANGELLSRPVALALMEAAVREAARVALAYGVKVASDPLAMAIAVCRGTASNSSSMRQDIRQGRRTEIEAINGMVVKRAAPVGVPVPVNQALLAGVKALECGGAWQAVSPMLAGLA